MSTEHDYTIHLFTCCIDIKVKALSFDAAKQQVRQLIAEKTFIELIEEDYIEGIQLPTDDLWAVGRHPNKRKKKETK